MTRNELITAAIAINGKRNLNMKNIHRMPTKRLEGIVEMEALSLEIEANPRQIKIAQPYRGPVPQASWNDVVIRPASIND